MRLGIAFDLIPSSPSGSATDGPDDAFEEFDKPETVDAIANVLRGRGHYVLLLGNGPEFLRRVLDDPPDLVWNMAEGRGVGRCREARVPAVLEMLDIPYTGSDALTLAVSLDKDVAKRLVDSGGNVLVPGGSAFGPGTDEEVFRIIISQLLNAPDSRVILKPSFEGSSKGVRGRCLATTVDEAWETYRDLSATYLQDIVIEKFVAGDEVTVGLIGNGSNVEVIGAMRIRPKVADPLFVYSLEVKRDWQRRVEYESPAQLPPDVERSLFDAARRSYELLGCRDLARIDFRLRGDEPFFIEANPLPGLAPVTSDLVILAAGYGISHVQLIGRIFDAALARLGMNG